MPLTEPNDMTSRAESNIVENTCRFSKEMVFLGIQRGNEVMKSNAIATVVKMIETLPEETQDQVVEHLRRINSY